MRAGPFTATEPNCLSDNTWVVPATTGPRIFRIWRTTKGAAKGVLRIKTQMAVSSRW